MDHLRQAAAETAAKQGKTLDDEVRRLIGAADEPDIKAYWQRVETSLRDGKVRLVFVADAISKEGSFGRPRVLPL